jgi:D-xylonolactonase
MRAELAWDAGCRLGEGIVWSAGDASVVFVDVLGQEVLAFTPASGATRRWRVPQPVGWVLPRVRGGWVAGFAEGPQALTLEPAVVAVPLHRLHAAGSSMRLNDAKVDARGRLWFGSMNHGHERQPDGRFYRWTAGSDPVEVDAGWHVTNGPAFSLDGRTLWHTDSVLATVFAYDLADDGSVSNKRAWLRFEAGEGLPDGMTTDADGHLWIAHWAGGCVTQRDAATGRVLRRIDVPVPNVTNLAFGGPDLADLYITTARAGLAPAARAAAPLAGALFVVRGAGRGRLPDPFAG